MRERGRERNDRDGGGQAGREKKREKREFKNTHLTGDREITDGKICESSREGRRPRAARHTSVEI